MTFPVWLALADTLAHVVSLTWLGLALWRLKQERLEHEHLARVASDTHEALRDKNTALRADLVQARRELAAVTAARARDA